MASLLSSLLSFILLYKYTAIFIVVFLSALAVPLPAVTILIVAGALASQGYLDFKIAVATGSIANILGDNITYWLVRRYGTKLINHLHRRRFSALRFLATTQGYLDHHPVITIFFSRFVTWATVLVNLLAGIAQVPFRLYLFWEATGEIGATFFYCTLGYLFGDSWPYLTDTLGHISLLIAGTVLFALLIWWWQKNKPHNSIISRIKNRS